MDQLEALRETVARGAAKGMPEQPGSTVGLHHLRGMVEAAEVGAFPADKLGRWLGWAQCAVVAANIGFTLDDMRSLNARSESGECGFVDQTAEPVLRNEPDSYWKRQYRAAERAKMLAIGYADQAEARRRKEYEAAASAIAALTDAVGWVRNLHQPSAAAVCTECGRDWPCATIRAVGDSV